MIRLLVEQITGPYCGTHKEGDALYEEASRFIRQGQQIELDFTGIQLASSSFFNEFFSRNLEEFGELTAHRSIKFIGLMPRHQFVLRKIQEPSPA